MPLSNEFSDSRLSYLQNAIKNSEIVAQQFYPRFVREYNEQFPFTEQRVSNVLNPTNNNSVIKDYLNTNNSAATENLILKLNTLTNDESMSKQILNELKKKLSESQLRYYNDNFNSIQKKVRIPYEGISKLNFVEQVLMAFANDNVQNDVSIFKNENKKPLGRPVGSYGVNRQVREGLIPSTTATNITDNLKGLPSYDLLNPPENIINVPNPKKKRSESVTTGKNQKGNGINPLKPISFKDRVIKHKKVFNNKYAIDTKKLKKNILDLKYLKNANHVSTFQPIEISSYLKNIIENIIKENYNIQKEEFISLNYTEKRILKRLFNFLKINNDDVIDYEYDIQKRFEVAYGSFLAGNTNKELIQELKDYIKLALHENTINKTDGHLILKKLNNNK